MINKNDKIVLDLLNKVKEKQEEIGKSRRPNWKTNCSFSTVEENANNRVNIQTIREINKLVAIYAWFLAQEKAYAEAITELKIHDIGKYDGSLRGFGGAFQWLGSISRDWKDDIKSRIDQIAINDKIKELEALNARLNSLISVEQRRELELAEISKILGDK